MPNGKRPIPVTEIDQWRESAQRWQSEAASKPWRQSPNREPKQLEIVGEAGKFEGQLTSACEFLLKAVDEIERLKGAYVPRPLLLEQAIRADVDAIVERLVKLVQSRNADELARIRELIFSAWALAQKALATEREGCPHQLEQRRSAVAARRTTSSFLSGQVRGCDYAPTASHRAEGRPSRDPRESCSQTASRPGPHLRSTSRRASSARAAAGALSSPSR